MSQVNEQNFSNFGKHFQEVTMAALLSDERFSEQMLEVFDPKYFDLKHLSFLSERYFKYAKKYRVFPTLTMLLDIVKDELKLGSDIILRDAIVAFAKKMMDDEYVKDMSYAKDKSLEFCRKKALQSALEEAVDQIQRNNYDSIVEIVKKAVSVGTAPDIGHDFMNDIDARYTKLQRDPIPTGIPALDQKLVLDGGLGRGELGVVTAATGVGKSHFLVALGVAAIIAGYDVVHYTFELSAEQIGRRYDANICAIDASDIIERKEDVVKTYENLKDAGRLFIKYFPTGTATINTIRAHLERLQLQKAVKPRLIIIDYADIMRSTRHYDQLRLELKHVYEELRGLAGEYRTAIWTASQSNKEGSTQEVIDLGNMGESYGKAQTADFVVSLSRLMHEKASGKGRLYVAKNRAGRDGLLYNVTINTARSTFDVGSELNVNPDKPIDVDDELKRRLKKKWDELNSQPELSKAREKM